MTKSLQPSHEAPFRGLRVLDFGQGVASPYAGYLLAANGADVIKIEPPDGDYGRLCSVLSREDLAKEPRYASFAFRADCAEELAAELRKVFAIGTTASWLSRLHAADIIADRILNPSEWIANEHVRATHAALRTETPGVGYVFAARTPGMAGNNEASLCVAPDIGQQTEAIPSGSWL